MLLTNGAAEAFTLLARGLRPRRAVCVHPAAAAPEAALQQPAIQYQQVLLYPPFDLDPALVPADADLVVLGDPTNPTARLHPVDALERLARPGRVLVVDEAFADAVGGEPASWSPAGPPRPGRGPQPDQDLGLAGLRVGYLLAGPGLVARLAAAQPPWPVNSLALEALAACCQPDAVAWADTRPDRSPPGGPVSPARSAGSPASPWSPRGGRRSCCCGSGRAPGPGPPAGPGVAVRRGGPPRPGPQLAGIAVAAPEHHDRILDSFSRACPAHGRPRRGRPGCLRDCPADRPGDAGWRRSGRRRSHHAPRWQALHAADVVVTDRLADPELTAQLRPGVRLIDAGKLPGAHQLSQEAITEGVVAHARAGRQVVRLKGGDPFVFGRGGEEVLACANAGIPCSVVPGLSSVTSAPTLAGIPVTHRGLNQSFTVLSGHLPPGHPDSTVDWPGLARSAETLVLLMAVGNLEHRRLPGRGRPAIRNARRLYPASWDPPPAG